jgi:hypothetical protein
VIFCWRRYEYNPKRGAQGSAGDVEGNSSQCSGGIGDILLGKGHSYVELVYHTLLHREAIAVSRSSRILGGIDG